MTPATQIHQMLNDEEVDYGDIMKALRRGSRSEVFTRPIDEMPVYRPEPADVRTKQPARPHKSKQERKHEADHRRERIVEFVGQYFATHYRPPTVREIGDGAGISSTSMVVYHMRVLVADGLVLDTGEHGENRRYVPAWLPGAIAREMQRKRGQSPDKRGQA